MADPGQRSLERHVHQRGAFSQAMHVVLTGNRHCRALHDGPKIFSSASLDRRFLPRSCSTRLSRTIRSGLNSSMALLIWVLILLSTALFTRMASGPSTEASRPRASKPVWFIRQMSTPGLKESERTRQEPNLLDTNRTGRENKPCLRRYRTMLMG